MAQGGRWQLFACVIVGRLPASPDRTPSLLRAPASPELLGIPYDKRLWGDAKKETP